MLPGLKVKILSFILFISAFAFAPSVFAASSANPSATRSNEIKANACENRKSVLRDRMRNLMKMAKNMTEVFTNISNRVITFYENKVLPGGEKLSNYDALTKAIETKKEAVDKAIEKAGEDSLKFDCGNEPKKALTTFRKDMQDVKTALKEYRTSIRNLIVAVHTLNKDNNGTPDPTK